MCLDAKNILKTDCVFDYLEDEQDYFLGEKMTNIHIYTETGSKMVSPDSVTIEEAFYDGSRCSWTPLTVNSNPFDIVKHHNNYCAWRAGFVMEDNRSNKILEMCCKNDVK